MNEENATRAELVKYIAELQDSADEKDATLTSFYGKAGWDDEQGRAMATEVLRLREQIEALRAKLDSMPIPNSEPLEIYIDPGDASTETLQELFAALSDLNVAAGGLGLQFKTDGNLLVAEGVEL